MQIDKAVAAGQPDAAFAVTIIATNIVFFLLGGIVIAFILESLDTGCTTFRRSKA